MGLCGGPLATPLSPTPPQVGYVSALLHLILLIHPVQVSRSALCYLLAALLDRIATLERWLAACRIYTGTLAARLDCMHTRAQGVQVERQDLPCIH